MCPSHPSVRRFYHTCQHALQLPRGIARGCAGSGPGIVSSTGRPVAGTGAAALHVRSHTRTYTTARSARDAGARLSSSSSAAGAAPGNDGPRRPVPRGRHRWAWMLAWAAWVRRWGGARSPFRTRTGVHFCFRFIFSHTFTNFHSPCQHHPLSSCFFAPPLQAFPLPKAELQRRTSKRMGSSTT